MSLFHDPLRLLPIQFWKQRVQFHSKSIAAFIIFHQTDQSTRCGVFDRCAQSPGCIDQRAMVTCRIGTGEHHFRIGSAVLNTLLQRVAQGDVQQPLR